METIEAVRPVVSRGIVSGEHPTPDVSCASTTRVNHRGHHNWTSVAVFAALAVRNEAPRVVRGPSNPLCRNTRQHSDDGEEEEHGDTGAVGNDGDRAQSRGKHRETAAAQGGHGKARGNRVRRKGPEPEPDPAGCRPFPRRKGTRTCLDAVQHAAPINGLQDAQALRVFSRSADMRFEQRYQCSAAVVERARLALEVLQNTSNSMPIFRMRRVHRKKVAGRASRTRASTMILATATSKRCKSLAPVTRSECFPRRRAPLFECVVPPLAWTCTCWP